MRKVILLLVILGVCILGACSETAAGKLDEEVNDCSVESVVQLCLQYTETELAAYFNIHYDDLEATYYGDESIYSVAITDDRFDTFGVTPTAIQLRLEDNSFKAMNYYFEFDDQSEAAYEFIQEFIEICGTFTHILNESAESKPLDSFKSYAEFLKAIEENTGFSAYPPLRYSVDGKTEIDIVYSYMDESSTISVNIIPQKD